MRLAILLDVPDGNADDYRFNVEVIKNVHPYSGDDVADRYRVNLKARVMPKMMDEIEYMLNVSDDGDWYEQVVGWNNCIAMIEGKQNGECDSGNL